MAKLFMQELPTQDQIQASASTVIPDADAGVLYSNLLFMKVATELENHFDSLLSRYNLSSGRFTLLMMLRRNPQGLMPSELSSGAGVTQATISGLLNNMEKAELIRRESHEKDGRSFVIKITEKGEATIKEILPLWYPRVNELWGQFSEGERGEITTILEKMVTTTGLFSNG